MKRENRRYVICILYPDKHTEFLADNILPSANSIPKITKNINHAQVFSNGWYNGIAANKIRLIDFFKKKYKKGERPRVFALLKKW